MGYMYYLDLALNKWFNKVWEALEKRDLEVIEKTASELAYEKHIELLKDNMPCRRVKSIEELKREVMQGLNLLHAVALARIFETIKEGEEHYYLNLKITKENGEIKIENVGWDHIHKIVSKESERDEN